MADARNLMKQFYALQEERVEAYKLFDEGFQAYLAGAPNYNFNMYKQLVKQITDAFQEISQNIIKVKSSLNDAGWNVVACYIEKIQEDEKVKLELTAALQLTTQHTVDYPDDSNYKQEVSELKVKLNNIIERITEHLDELKYESEDIYSS